MAKQEIGVIRTTMAAAMLRGFDQCVASGQNPGRVGHRILTNKAKGVGVKYVPRPKKKEETLHLKKGDTTAVSAEKVMVEA